MDHSITEQLTGHSHAWHTTALAMSSGSELASLAARIAERINPLKPRLRKWSAGRPKSRNAYRLAFSAALGNCIQGSKVMLLVISATEAAIVGAREQVVRELGISEICKEEKASTG